ncbi:MarR family winged helix-turn-helix transcriptional regulator [Paraclostridium sordellii]|uniref:MarR-family transcriptional regulator n=1 Tax=Paraclostridium sordellii TaxID=1505 RepID=A0A0C7HVJ2_PARSO|nr:MarR family transcriptional regulator [Paeniclostridium sordellii]CEN79583.1 MarR-family transcriptional regulator [[Clostridium] sordellii] [Paeniclostridium sordellii]CEO05589.1 MarR-family transcriptional regulator [[Clostridium] sordellii] [Paeniclostridium sordellii]CEP86125.1 MarR-family transcriptional regulator [[Clostridium] sordellii] [Paeniclostridium sordellii]CEP96377.1 MarR-family transcriptional regulator [[Clostridium] sordellii] [Paeniclostridium sordellii]CEQ00157.1 MarR-f
MNKESYEKKRHIGKYISQLYRKSSVFINKELAKYGIRSGQLMFLMDLYLKDGKNQEEISERLKIDKATTARALKKLEEQDFIKRIRDDNDKRSNKIYLTDTSKDLKEEVYGVLDEWNEKISKSLTREEKETLANLLEKVCKNINA